MAWYRKKVLTWGEPFKRGMEDGAHFRQDLPPGVKPVGFEVGDPHDTVIYPYINTLEGRHYISPGDYIMKGAKGERYPCKPDIFEQTYEKVLDDDSLELLESMNELKKG